MVPDTTYILIPLLPLLAFLGIGLGGRWLSDRSHRLAIPAILASFALSVLACLDVARHGPRSIPLYRLIESGSLVVDTGLYLDALAAVLLLLVTGVSALVHVFSSRYMQGDPRYARFFAVTALFTFSMIMLVLSENLLMLYMFWEIMGLCSYLLISHWSARQSACRAATKAFLVNAVADVGLGFGVILTWATFGTLDIQRILASAPELAGRTLNLLGPLGLDWQVPVLPVLAVLLFMGAVGKSAQLPLHVWLPFAMEAPTPVSALIHAATMVNAGVYLLVRLGPLYLLAPAAMTVVAVIGGATALFAGTVALTQSDIKRILAYSTISQLGFMVLACGVGAYVAAVFHLLAHGALKAFLFLSSGSALQHLRGTHEHAELGVVRASLARRAWSPYAVALALALLPALLIFSGPYERLWTATPAWQARLVFWVLGLATVFLAALALFRWITGLFGAATAQGVHPGRRSPVLPTSLLLGFIPATAGLAALLLATWTGFVQLLTPAVAGATQAAGEALPPSPWTPASLLPAIGAAVAGWAVAFSFHLAPPRPVPRWADLSKTLYVFFLNKGYLDEVYEAAVVRPTLRFAAWLWRVVDVLVFDRAFSSLADFSVALARWLWEVVDLRVIDRLVSGVATFSLTLARWLWEVVDLRMLDRVVSGLATVSLTVARWLWEAVDLRLLDRAILGFGSLSLRMARWLWQIVDIRGVERVFGDVGRRSDATGHALTRVEPRLLQHHILVMILWMVVGIGFFFWLILD